MLLPGRCDTLWFPATEPDSYHLFRPQFCGTDHAEWLTTQPGDGSQQDRVR